MAEELRVTSNGGLGTRHIFWLRKKGSGAVIVGLDGWKDTCDELLSEILENTDWQYGEMDD